ncbi:type II toxin-antitoxin system VapC family toxin [Cyanobacterium aponinum UTEX 3222]|uniref:type II toxin-antitoxin system VapC family toxin n=1 Tax=Cyanobacterium aponinum TaxID=379064 RepID=UPI0030928D69|nr:type II toxin-antitoxin system VapC family toxin [Cyanobacterium aponinum UTEX 3222]
MRFLLDTDHISFLQRKSDIEHEILIRRIRNYSPDDFAFSIISFHEQIIGAHTYIIRSQNSENLYKGYRLLQQIINSFSEARILDFEKDAIAIFQQLKNQKIGVSTMDLRIASIALSRNLILLTRNQKDFTKIPNLIIEDWTQIT